MAKAEIIGDVIGVVAEYREKPAMKSIGGARWQRDGYWAMPLSWGTCIRLRSMFGSDLEIGDDLRQWAATQKILVRNAELAKEIKREGEFSFQVSGTEFLFQAGSAVLADEMGLGKSKQVIDLLKLGADGPVLIVCPNSLKYTWVAEFEKWGPQFSVVVADGTASKKKKALEADADVVIINWESLKSFSRLAPFGSLALTDKEKESGLLNRNWNVVVADEAHRAKDPKAKQTRALWAIGASAKRRIALTGTPIANSPEDLWSIMRFAAPEDWPSRTAFIDRYCQTAYNFFGGLDIVGINPHTKDELFAILDPRFLRRTKAEVLKSLPAKTYQTRFVELSAKQRKLYKSMEEDMVVALDNGVAVATNPLTQLGRLSQLAQATATNSDFTKFEAPSCKIDALFEILDEAPGEPIVVFAVNVAFAKLIVAELEKAGISVDDPITGELPSAIRADIVKDFQEGKNQVIVLTAAAGGEGLTLTRASRCVFLQRPWSAVQYKQAQDRIHRVGQTASVQIIDVVAKDTIEERILDVLDEKDETLQTVCRDPHWVKSALTRKEAIKNAA